MAFAILSNVKLSLQISQCSIASTSRVRLPSTLIPPRIETCPQCFLTAKRRTLHVGYAKSLKARKEHSNREEKPSKASIPTLPSSIPDFSPPPPPSKELVLQTLKKRIETWSQVHGLPRRIVSLGIEGPALRDIVIFLRPEDSRKDGNSTSLVKALIQSWADEASNCLVVEDKPTTTSSHQMWDLDNVQNAFEAEGAPCLDRLCMQSFLRWLEAHLIRQSDDGRLLAHLQSLLSAVDVRFFPLDFPEARSMVRKIHLHVGPTNSGKTHGALVALCKANTGLYAGPLRLLAHEVWDRINTGKVSTEISARPCNLLTGEEVKMVDDMAGLIACTVEMISLSQVVDVAVIDEIQMIGDPQRGSAWTTAVVGVPAKEVHLCGESSVIPLIKCLAEACGDEVHIHEYERLTPLQLGDHLESDLKNVQKGDCIVAFSRSEIFKLKNEIEEITSFKCALAYGALPPETKAEQAKIFNDPDNDFSIMVASDAIGMGLNLKIKRVVFASVSKWNGQEVVPISGSQLKQIAGRAGRYGTSKIGEEGGYATTLHAQDLPVLEAALQAPLNPITRAGIQAPSSNLALFASLLPEKKRADMTVGHLRPLGRIFTDVFDLCQIDSRLYFAVSMEQQFKVSPMIEETVPSSKELTIEEREKFAIAPANTRDERLMALLANMISYYVRGEVITFKMADGGLEMLKSLSQVESIQKEVEKKLKSDMNNNNKGPLKLSELIAKEPIGMRTELLEILESLHRGLTLYLWLSFRFPVNFAHSEEVTKLKERTERAIEFGLEAVKASRQQRLALLEGMRDGFRSRQGSSRGGRGGMRGRSDGMRGGRGGFDRQDRRGSNAGLFDRSTNQDRWNASV